MKRMVASVAIGIACCLMLIWSWKCSDHEAGSSPITRQQAAALASELDELLSELREEEADEKLIEQVQAQRDEYLRLAN